MVQGLAPGQGLGWGQVYFSTVYTEDVAHDRARNTRDLVARRMLDYVLPVPTEPLAMLATTRPQPGLIETSTVAVANVALWRVHAFNQLVLNMHSFLTTNAAEITSADTDQDRRDELAAAAMSLSLFVHLDGIGQANAAFTDGSVGWYRALVERVSKNLGDLYLLQQSARKRWMREWPFVVVDAVVLTGLVAVAVAVITPHVHHHHASHRPALPPARTQPTLAPGPRVTTARAPSQSSP
jgi:hypothetical protein